MQRITLLWSLVCVAACEDTAFVPVQPDLDPPKPWQAELTTASESTTTTVPEVVNDCATDPLCVDVTTIDPVWTMEPGWGGAFNGWIGSMGDLDGDGYETIGWELAGPDGEVVFVLVDGPVDRARVLPRDADSRVIGGAVFAAGDATGDGIADLVIGVRDPKDLRNAPTSLLVGPVPEGEIDVATASLPPLESCRYPSRCMDVDHDGALERVEVYEAPGESRLWRGASTEWEGEPTVTFISEDPYQLVYPLDVRSDIDGDGIREMQVGWGWYVREDQTGELSMTVPAKLPVRRGSLPTPVGDQDGDGTEDYLWWDTLYAGPVAMSDVGLIVSEAIVSAPASIYPPSGWITSGFDTDADGSAELVHVIHDRTGGAANLWFHTGGRGGGSSRGCHTSGSGRQQRPQMRPCTSGISLSTAIVRGVWFLAAGPLRSSTSVPRRRCRTSSRLGLSFEAGPMRGMVRKPPCRTPAKQVTSAAV